jgi:hypothetical protein
MITLGLGNIPPMQREFSPVAPQTLSEMVEHLEPSAVLRALSETIAWCLGRSLNGNELRSGELDPSSSLSVPPLDEIGVDAFVVKKRESYPRAVQSINAIRSILLRDANIEVVDPAKSRGRLLLYEPLETVTDGASASSSRGFFDIEDAPPWDTWFLYLEGSVVSWVPESLVQNAQAGIDANPVDCIHWCDWSKFQRISAFSTKRNP